MLIHFKLYRSDPSKKEQRKYYIVQTSHLNSVIPVPVFTVGATVAS